MELDYEVLENELIYSLRNNKVWILATCAKNKTTARSVSIINEGITAYFQTNRELLKYRQIVHNPNVALCHSNVSIEAIAEDMGDWDSPQNKSIMLNYIKVHKPSFDTYGHMHDLVVIKINPIKATFWKYIDGKPFRDYLFITEKTALREEYALE